MNERTRPLVLHQATIALYLSDSAGNPVLALPVWAGARAEQVFLGESLEEIAIPETESADPVYGTLEHAHLIRIRRIWSMRADPQADFDLGARTECVMVIQWNDGLFWKRRTYRGVVALQQDQQSQGVITFVTEQVFRARSFTGDEGLVGAAGEELPAAASAVLAVPVLFTREAPVEDGTYLVGEYTAPGAVRIGDCSGVAQGGGTEVTLTLEVAGSLTAHTLTVAAGAGEQTDAADPDLVLTEGQAVRWKVTGSGAYRVSVSMNVTEE